MIFNNANLESPSRQLTLESEQADSIGHAAKVMMADQVRNSLYLFNKKVA